MGRRLSVLLRGPGVLIITLAIIAIVASAHFSAVAAPTGGILRPPTPVATVHPQPLYVLRESRSTSLLDTETHTLAALRALRLQPLPDQPFTSTGVLAGLVEVYLENLGNRTIHCSPGDFFLLADTGETYLPLTPLWPYHELTAGSLTGGTGTSGWIRFDLPAIASKYTLYWTDDNHLLPPEKLARVSLQQSSS